MGDWILTEGILTFGALKALSILLEVIQKIPVKTIISTMRK